MVGEATGLLTRYHERLQACPETLPPAVLAPLSHATWTLEAQVEGLRSDGRSRRQLGYTVSRLKDSKGKAWYPSKLLPAWVDHLIANAAAGGVTTEWIGLDASLTLPPIDRAGAIDHLQRILAAWDEGQRRPLPLACQTAFAWLQAVAEDKSDPLEIASSAYAGDDHQPGEVGYDPYLRRAYPHAEWLLADPAFADWAERLYGPLWQAVKAQDEAEKAGGRV